MNTKFLKTKVGKQTIISLLLFLSFPFLYVGTHNSVPFLTYVGLLMIISGMVYTTYLGYKFKGK